MPIWVNQSGVIPVLDGQLCMVTSRSGRRWVFPKGQIDPGHTPSEAALVEAWEEAGLTGILDPEPIGNYVYEKFERSYHVLVYRMWVTKALAVWPESELREREWMTVPEALDRVEEHGLREVLRRAFSNGTTDRITLARA